MQAWESLRPSQWGPSAQQEGGELPPAGTLQCGSKSPSGGRSLHGSLAQLQLALCACPARPWMSEASECLKLRNLHATKPGSISVTEHLPSTHGAPGSMPSTGKQGWSTVRLYCWGGGVGQGGWLLLSVLPWLRGGSTSLWRCKPSQPL